MVSRQVGHFFFEPKGYDKVNQATHEHKEDIKVGYNLQAQDRAAVALGAVAGGAVVQTRHCSGYFRRPRTTREFLRTRRQVWLAWAWCAVVPDGAAVLSCRDVQTGLVWFTKIITDPFHDIMLYCRAPLYLLRGELRWTRWRMYAPPGLKQFAQARAGGSPGW